MPAANGAITGFQGGGWALLFAVGFDTAVSETLPINQTAAIASNCTFTAATSATTVTIPGTTLNRSSGTSPAWEFAYRNGAGTLAIVAVLSGTGSVRGTRSGQCVSFFGLLSPVPANVIDSSAAAASVESNASGFLARHPNASAVFGLIGGFRLLGQGIGAEWSVTYSTCSLAPTASGAGSEFNATVNAVTGKVLFSASTSVSCSGGSTSTTNPLGSSLAFGAPSVATTGPYPNYTYLAELASNGVAWDNFTAEVQSGASPVTAGWNLTARSLSGVEIATYDTVAGAWSAGGSTPILAGDEMVLSTTTNLAGDLLVLTGQGSFSGTIETGL